VLARAGKNTTFSGITHSIRDGFADPLRAFSEAKGSSVSVPGTGQCRAKPRCIAEKPYQCPARPTCNRSRRSKSSKLRLIKNFAGARGGAFFVRCAPSSRKAVMDGRADEIVDFAKTNLWR
jgi:hypothetical protein